MKINRLPYYKIKLYSTFILKVHGHPSTGASTFLSELPEQVGFLGFKNGADCYPDRIGGPTIYECEFLAVKKGRGTISFDTIQIFDSERLKQHILNNYGSQKYQIVVE